MAHTDLRRSALDGRCSPRTATCCPSSSACNPPFGSYGCGRSIRANHLTQQ